MTEPVISTVSPNAAWSYHLQFQRMAEGSGGRFAPRDIQRAVEDGRMQLWVIRAGNATKAVIVTEITEYPRRRAFRMIGCVGEDWQDWAGLREDLRRYAREQGCDLMELQAPAKWRHAFPDYTAGHVVFERDV